MGQADIDFMPLHWPPLRTCASADARDKGEGQALFCPSLINPATANFFEGKLTRATCLS